MINKRYLKYTNTCLARRRSRARAKKWLWQGVFRAADANPKITKTIPWWADQKPTGKGKRKTKKLKNTKGPATIFIVDRSGTRSVYYPAPGIQITCSVSYLTSAGYPPTAFAALWNGNWLIYYRRLLRATQSPGHAETDAVYWAGDPAEERLPINPDRTPGCCYQYKTLCQAHLSRHTNKIERLFPRYV